jgi:hypothetical protein
MAKVEGRAARKAARRTRVLTQACIERLEDRRLLTAGDLDPTFGSGGLVTTADSLPAAFVENQGQWIDASVRYAYSGSGASIAFTNAGPKFVLFKQDTSVADPAGAAATPADAMTAPPALQSAQLSMSFVGSHEVSPAGEDRAEGEYNYFVGDQATWRSNVPGFSTVAYNDIYSGVDLRTSGHRGGLKYEFHVAPGADYRQINIHYEGTQGLSVDSEGSLHVSLAGDWAELVDAAPYVYQIIGGQEVPVAGAFELIDGTTYGFRISGVYDPALGLVIDPDLAWSTYLGGSSNDFGYGIATDASGNALVTGETDSSGWVSGGFDTSFNGYSDAFVAKISPSGGHIWSTYLGGSSIDAGYSIATDASGNVLVAGVTASSGWVSGGFDTSFNNGVNAGNGPYDGFAAKLSPSGGYIWSTYLGGNGTDFGYGIAADASGNVLVTGSSYNRKLWIGD